MKRVLWHRIRPIGPVLLVTAVLLAFLPAGASAAGELDPSFDTDGKVLTNFGAYEGANGTAIQADGKIVAAGTSASGANGPGDFALARYNADGSLDTASAETAP